MNPTLLDAFDDFYGDVVQRLREWQAAAPKLQTSEAGEIEATPASSAGGDATQSIGNTIAANRPASSDSSIGKPELKQRLEATGNNGERR